MLHATGRVTQDQTPLPVFVGKPRLRGDSLNPATHQWSLQWQMWLLAGRRGWPTLTPLSWELGTGNHLLRL